MTRAALEALGLPIAKVEPMRAGRRYRVDAPGAPAATGTLLLAAASGVGGTGKAWFELDGTGQKVWLPCEWLTEERNQNGNG